MSKTKLNTRLPYDKPDTSVIHIFIEQSIASGDASINDFDSVDIYDEVFNSIV